LQAIGEWDNTVFIFLSDNGGSAEVGIEGASNALRYFHKRPATTAQNLEDFDAIGGVTTHPHYPRGWMQVSNTPFIHSKRTSHGGGVRVPLIISWPRDIEQHGIRHQFHHITDIMPTLMEILGIALPREHEGRVIEPMEGTSMAYSFDDPDAKDRKTEQYYEIEGRRAYYDNGWKIISYREPGQDSMKPRGSSTTWPRTSPNPMTSPPNTPRGSSHSKRNGGRPPEPTACCRSSMFPCSNARCTPDIGSNADRGTSNTGRA
jgi:arylsulfatase